MPLSKANIIKFAEFCMYQTSHYDGSFNSRLYDGTVHSTESLLKLFLEQNKLVKPSVKVNPSDDFEKRRKAFADSLRPYLDQYGKDMLNAFYTHFAEANATRTKMLWETKDTFELPLRLARWARNDKTFNKKEEVPADGLSEAARQLLAKQTQQNG